jgi:hypothetical protein
MLVAAGRSGLRPAEAALNIPFRNPISWRRRGSGFELSRLQLGFKAAKFGCGSEKKVAAVTVFLAAGENAEVPRIAFQRIAELGKAQLRLGRLLHYAALWAAHG